VPKEKNWLDSTGRDVVGHHVSRGWSGFERYVSRFVQW
jgi:hypothetical protein